MALDSELAELSMTLDGKTVIFPCIEIMALSKLPKNVASGGYVRFYEAFARRYGARFTYYQLNDSTGWKRFLPKDHAKVRSWFSDRRSLEAPLLGIDIHTSDTADEPRPPSFEMMFEHVYPEYPRGMFRLVLPVDMDLGALLELVDDALAEFPVHWGTAGYAFYWKSTDTKIEKYAGSRLCGHLMRHPGLATGEYMMWGTIVEQGVANIGWLTFIGDALVDRLGGREELARLISGTGVSVRAYGRGVGLQAGLRPELGDVNRRELLPTYHEVGRLLEPVFAPDELLETVHVPGFHDPDQRLAWLRRFLP